MPTQTIAIASDHAGFELKCRLKDTLAELRYDVLDLGTDSADSVDYPDYAYAVADAIMSGRAQRGVLICGNGIGIGMAANRYREIRAATVHDIPSARMSRLHNDANVICLGGRTTEAQIAEDCLKVFLETNFEHGRHVRRVEKLSNPTRGEALEPEMTVERRIPD